LRETNPDSTNPDGFDYGARIIAEQTFMGLLAPYSNSEGICSTGARNKAAAKLYSNRKADEAAYVKPTRKLLRTNFIISDIKNPFHIFFLEKFIKNLQKTYLIIYKSK